jgi:hypothetical protein
LNLDKEVKAHLKYWQKQLRLMDWDISVKIYEDPKEFDMFGRNKINRNYQTSEIELLNPEKVPEDWTGVRDIEVTIVHELLHLRFTFCPPKKSDHYHNEMATETTAKALVANRRGIDPEELV